MLTVYGIDSCDTCRKARRYFEANDITYVFHDLREDGLDPGLLERWARRVEWQKLVNRQSLTWRRIPEADRNQLTRRKAFDLLLEHPTLLKRPVIEHEDYIAVGFSEAAFAEFLDRSG